MSDRFDLDHFFTIPRLSGLRVSPDGERLLVTVQRPGPDGKKMHSSIWDVDPAGQRRSRRLTRSAPGESGGVFLRDGSILFTSSRPDPDRKPEDGGDDKEITGLWLLPAGGGEARMVVGPHGGVDAIRTAREADVIAFAASVHPRTSSLKEDSQREKERKESGASAQLFESYPIRLWDHYLGPRERHLYLADAPDAIEGRIEQPFDLTPDAARALDDVEFDVTPDGSTIVTGWVHQNDLVHPSQDIVAIERGSGERRQLASGPEWHQSPRCSPDGRWVVCVRDTVPSPEEPPDTTLWLIDLATGEGRDLTPEIDLWPHGPEWSADSRSVFFLADRLGHSAVLRADLDGGAVTVLAAEGAYSDLSPAPDGRRLFALRSTLRSPPRVVELATDAAEQTGRVIPSPLPLDEELRVSASAEQLTTRLDDGTEIRSWLVKPADASAESPAPLLLWIHGGPLASWNGWHWRWNPHLLADRGYAVLLPDPALSTGYGLDMIRRGWGKWGEAPYSDLMAVVDRVIERPDIDAERTAAMGGSFGGYMANWVAGHTDRFKAIVTHASLWELRGFHGTTDWGPMWEAEFGDPYSDPSRYEAASPHASVGEIRTPLLVIHGEKDHRVPISEALRLWTDLSRHGADAKFLYFPDENHWIMKPPNARVWYETVVSFLDQHVRGKEWQRPALL